MEIETSTEFRYGKNAEEKIIKILHSVDLKKLTEDTVKNMFKKAYPYLEQREDFERAAELRVIEHDYLLEIA